MEQQETRIGNLIGKGIIVVMGISMSIIALSCSNDNVLNLEEKGYVLFTASLTDMTTSKANVPECSGKQPVSVMYRLLNEEGFAFTGVSDITIDNNVVTATDQMAFTVGSYTIDEISLFDSDNNITHTVPHQLDSRFSFYNYFDNYLPSTINILPGEIVNSPDFNVVCYTEQEIQLGEFGLGLGIADLETLFYIINEEQNCLAYVTITIDYQLVQSVPVTLTGLYAIPIPKDHNTLSIAGFEANGNVRQVFNLANHYDGRVFYFQPNCN